MKTVFVTKYWETTGILEFEGEITDNGLFRGKPTIRKPNEWIFNGIFSPRYFSDTRDGAIQQCIKNRERKIKSTEKKLDKLKKMTFE